MPVESKSEMRVFLLFSEIHNFINHEYVFWFVIFSHSVNRIHIEWNQIECNDYNSRSGSSNQQQPAAAVSNVQHDGHSYISIENEFRIVEKSISDAVKWIDRLFMRTRQRITDVWRSVWYKPLSDKDTENSEIGRLFIY